VLLGTVLGLSSATAAELTDVHPWRADGCVVVDVRARDLLDPSTRSTVEAGLPGTLSLSLVLEQEDGEALAERVLQRDLELDIWEGGATLRDDEGSRGFASLAAADSAWANFDALRLAPLHSLSSSERYRVRVRIWVRPLGAEDRRRIARWVSRTESGDRRDVRLDVGQLLQHFVGEREDDTEQGAAQGSSAVFDPSRLASRGLRP